MNRTIVAMLKKYVSNNGKDWDIKLPLILMAIRSNPQRSTGVTPFEMMTGRQMTLLLHLLYHPEDDGGHLDDWHSCWLHTCSTNRCNTDRTTNRHSPAGHPRAPYHAM
ncbi:hypothetical protein XENOCAPTIV_025295 [Xenoophorus captivus]|uniref:Uncharacterized protein n=1 Tax=Xenoophorus captivus TaxID=1517983 RepID=A0ABV0R1Z4_9TELE